MALSPQHLWCQVGWRAAETTSLRVVHHTNLGEAEICQKGVAIFIKDDIVWLEVAEDDVTTVEVFEGQQNLSEIQSGPILIKSLVFLQGSAHVATRCVIEEQEKFLGRLEGILQTHDERMVHERQDISLCLGVLHQVLSQDLLFVEDFHGVVLSCALLIGVNLLGSELLDEVDYSEGALTKLHQRFEVFGPNELLAFLVLPLQLLVKFPNFDKLVLPACV
mmetsp:Transcript_20987/g.28231  ORF Transcript_20987/g.28231 Transcript_20987/m.28231 type:complete len:220 (-) Transcript_20987:1507-2166(-)